jgi:short-subunit dehydrogenase
MPEEEPEGFDCVLVTGASSGLGAEYARQLASLSRRMVLVARREDLLLTLEQELRAAHPELEVGSISVDLASGAARQELIERLRASGWNPSLLVNCAGLGDYGEFATSEWEKVEGMLEVNVTALTHLTHGFLPSMIEQGDGAIINVSSLAGDLAIPDFAVYAASKAYVTSFSEALRLELRGCGIPVLAVCPGPVSTGFGAVAQRGDGADQAEGLSIRDYFYTDKAQVVTESLIALSWDQARVYPGWKIALAAAGISLIPLAVLRLVMGRRPRRASE